MITVKDSLEFTHSFVYPFWTKKQKIESSHDNVNSLQQTIVTLHVSLQCCKETSCSALTLLI